MIRIIWYPEAAFSTCSQSLCRRYLSEGKRRNDLRQTQNAHACGGVAEWSKAAVLKTVEPRGSVGSNPTASASKIPDRQNAAHAAYAASIDKLKSRSAKRGPDQQNAAFFPKWTLLEADFGKKAANVFSACVKLRRTPQNDGNWTFAMGRSAHDTRFFPNRDAARAAARTAACIATSSIAASSIAVRRYLLRLNRSLGSNGLPSRSHWSWYLRWLQMETALPW